MNRRTFLGGLAAAAALLAAAPLGQPVGFQVYPVKDNLLKDFAGTLKEFAGIGYRSVEMCSPPGYGWTALTKMSGAEMKKITAIGSSGG